MAARMGDFRAVYAVFDPHQTLLDEHQLHSIRCLSAGFWRIGPRTIPTDDPSNSQYNCIELLWTQQANGIVPHYNRFWSLNKVRSVRRSYTIRS